MATIVTGLQAAITDRASHPTAPVAASLILCLVRELGEVAAAATLALTLPYLTYIEGLGLASSEVRALMPHNPPVRNHRSYELNLIH